MKVKDLREAIKDLPDDCEVYIEADHGQLPEQAHYVQYCQGDFKDLPYYGDELPFEFDAADVIESGDEFHYGWVAAVLISA